MKRVQQVVITIALGEPGTGYVVRVLCHVAGERLPSWDDTYDRLTWLEACDLVADQTASRRPGWMLDEGRCWQQLSLDDLYT